MTWVFVAVAAVAVCAVAWISIGIVSRRLAATPSMAVFDIEEATARIADALPERVAGRLSHDDVRVLLRWQLTYLRERGVASYGRVDHAAERAARRNRPVVADEDELVDEILSRCAAEGLDADPVDVVCVVDLTTEYLVAIGAVGAAVDVSGVPALASGDAAALPEAAASPEAPALPEAAASPEAPSTPAASPGEAADTRLDGDEPS